MNKKQNGYQNVNFTSFFNLRLGIAQFIDFVRHGGRNKHFWCLLFIVSAIVSRKIQDGRHFAYLLLK